jgi:hypothetical protein
VRLHPEKVPLIPLTARCRHRIEIIDTFTTPNRAIRGNPPPSHRRRLEEVPLQAIKNHLAHWVKRAFQAGVAQTSRAGRLIRRSARDQHFTGISLFDNALTIDTNCRRRAWRPMAACDRPPHSRRPRLANPSPRPDGPDHVTESTIKPSGRRRRRIGCLVVRPRRDAVRRRQGPG